MADFFFDTNDAGDGSFFVDSAGSYSTPSRAYLFDTIAAGDGSFYYDSLAAAAVGGLFYYLTMLRGA